MRSRSGVSTMAAKSATVWASCTSRFWAKSDMTRWFSTSQETSRMRSGSSPSRLHAASAALAKLRNW